MNTNNHLWLLRPMAGLPDKVNPWEPGYNKAFGFVVCAASEAGARQLANADGGDEVGPVNREGYRTGGNPWLDDKFSTCTKLTPEREVGVVLRDFYAA